MKLPHPNPRRVGYIACSKCGSLEWKVVDRKKGIVVCAECGKQALQYGRLDKIKVPETEQHWRTMVS